MLPVDFGQVASFARTLLIGATMTVQITVGSLFAAIILGFIFALFKISRFRVLRAVANVYVEMFRGVPVLAQLFIIYFGLGYVGIRFDPVSAAIIGLGLNGGSVLTEVFRAGFAALHHGQREAAFAVGMTPWMALRHIILPQTWRVTLPPLGNYAIALLKDTAVVSAIAAPEIMFYARNLVTSTFETTLVYVLAAALYFCLSFPLARVVDGLERAQRSWQ